MEPLYKVGDKVEVIARTANPGDYRFIFTDGMTQYTGEIVTIASFAKADYGSKPIPDDGYLYKIVEDRRSYSWASSMFHSLPAKIMSQSSDIPMTIRIKVKTNKLKFNFKN